MPEKKLPDDKAPTKPAETPAELPSEQAPPVESAAPEADTRDEPRPEVESIANAAHVAYTLIEASRLCLHATDNARAARYREAATRICDRIADSVLDE